MKSKLNLALVGTGRMGLAYARYLANRVPGATLYAVADVRLNAAQAVGAECGATRAVTDYRELLADKNVDGIVDWDNAITTLRFANGCIGAVTLSRNGVYGYGIHTEIVGTEGTIQIGYDRETPVLVLRDGAVSHDTIPGFYERFEHAYIAQLQDFVANLRAHRPPPITADDGIAAQAIAIAATRSVQEGRSVGV